MDSFLKKNTVTLLIVIATLILAGVAVFTAIRLYQTRQTSVAPNAPSSRPAAATVAPTSTPNPACQGSFTISAATLTPSPTATATATTSPTPVPQCGTSCSTNSDCPTSMVCYVGVCRNPSCTTSTTCTCASATPSPTSTATAIPTATPLLATVTTPTASGSATLPPIPVTGFDTPTILGIGGGAILFIAGLIFAL